MDIPDSPVKISCRHVWKMFGNRPKKRRRTLSRRVPRQETLTQNDQIVAVKDVSFDVRAGENFVIMGLSGSGKSTLLRCLSRLIEPTRGQIFIDGEDVMQMTKRQLQHLRRHKMSMVFQSFGLFPHRRVIENVAYGLEVRGIDKPERLEQARQVLELVGLAGWDQNYPHELSGGMQQRVGLARALAVNPEILMCDEPFSALDPLIRREMQAELLRLQRQLRKTLVFITHDFLEALKIGDRIAIMKDGEIVQIGTPQEVVSHPVNDYVRNFTLDVPRAKVLTAETIMEPVNGVVLEGLIHVAPEMSLESLIPLTAASDALLAVVDRQGRMVGVVSRTAVLTAITPKGA